MAKLDVPDPQVGKGTGGVVGYSHSGWGLALPDYDQRGNRVDIKKQSIDGSLKTRAADKLPDYAMPKFDGIGANEYVVTVTKDVCDFISSVDTPSTWELNVWYHTLNSGYRARISGETDFPCIYGARVGLGRIYVKLDSEENLTFDSWVAGLKDGRSYCGDGMSHIFDLKVNDVAVGEPGTNGKISQLDLDAPGKVKVNCEVSSLLSEQITEETESLRNRRLDEKPYWHVERARIGQTRKVPVELIVNGKVAATKEITADGKVNPLEFDLDLEHSSWVAVRILPTVHTNPVFVEVAGKPIRSSRKSAEWCRKAVDVCYNAKKSQFREEELAEINEVYDHARKMYDQIILESVQD